MTETSLVLNNIRDLRKAVVKKNATAIQNDTTGE